MSVKGRRGGGQNKKSIKKLIFEYKKKKLTFLLIMSVKALGGGSKGLSGYVH